MGLREEYNEIFRNGGSTFIKGKHIKNAGELPSEAELALGTGSEEATEADLEAEIKRLEGERAKLAAAKKVKAPVEKEVSKPVEKPVDKK